MKKTALLTAGFLALASTLAPAITFNVSLDQVTSSNGTLVGTNTLALLVVDTDGTGFSPVAPGATLALNSYLTASSDYIVGRGDFSGGDTGAGQWTFNFGIGTADVPNNRNLALFWFPTLTTSSTTIGSGVQYGFYTSSNSEQFGSNSAWNTGSNSAATNTLNAFTATNTGTFGTNPQTGGLSQASLQATLATVPEPSTYALMAVGAVGLFLSFRRRKVQA
jgi:hypothetical protein